MDDFLNRARNMLGDVAGQAGRQAEIMQLQAKLGALDDQRDMQYIEAGKRAHELLRMRMIHDDELRVILQRVKEIDEQMMELRAQVAKLTGGSGGRDEVGPDDAEDAGPESDN